MIASYLKEMSEIQKKVIDMQFNACSESVGQCANAMNFTFLSSNFVEEKTQDRWKEFFREGQTAVSDMHQVVHKLMSVKGTPSEVSKQLLQLQEVMLTLSVKNLAFCQDWFAGCMSEISGAWPKEYKNQAEFYQSTMEKSMAYIKQSTVTQFDAMRDAMTVEEKADAAMKADEKKAAKKDPSDAKSKAAVSK